ncbi:MAG: M23 family metallopeptidase [Rhodococcus sp. (in: high G+C Gram-positive bacteria)]
MLLCESREAPNLCSAAVLSMWRCGKASSPSPTAASRIVVHSSPADRVPSHGTASFATPYAIDFVPVDAAGRTAPVTFASLVRSERPAKFPGFGRAVLAPVEGVVSAAYDADPDHSAYRGLPSIGYALTQRRRVRAGWMALAGNHVLLDSGGIVVALCHLRQGSSRVQPGQRVQVGDVLGECGNPGNSTEPYVHVQAVDNGDIGRANSVRVTFKGMLPRNGEVIDAVP